ncbi:MAG TPA: polysaccharide biosynthesis protein, partial [Firmicutes bacterium]|nr:polysaccharide biosynthesis protein [Bacillota bacterium]
MLEKILRNKIILCLADGLFINASFFIALVLRFEGNIPGSYLGLYADKAVIITAISLLIYWLMGLYKKLWRYASILELINIVSAITLSVALLFALRPFGLFFPRSIYVIHWSLTLILVGGIRFSIRILNNLASKRAYGFFKNVLIVGAGEAGVLVAKELEKNVEELLAKPVGFIDDDPKKKGNYIHNIPILGGREDIISVITRKKVDEVIIAIPSASRKTVREIVEVCKKVPVKVKILPGVYQLIGGKVSLKKLRDVDIEDLLKREPVNIDLEEIAAYLKGKVVLVTGGGGSIGSEICRQVLSFEPEQLLIMGQGENSVYTIHKELIKQEKVKIIPLIGNVQDRARVEEIFETYKPGVIFHAAAHKHVPLMEENPKEAIKNNVFGTKNVAEAAHRHKAERFVLVSTDKAVNPSSVMGATKRIAEMVIQTLAQTSQTKFCAVRFGNVLGSRGSVVPLFREQIAAGGPVTVTHPDMVRYFMTIQEAAQLVIQAGAFGERGEVFILDMGEPVKIVDLAKDLIRLSGFEP